MIGWMDRSSDRPRSIFQLFFSYACCREKSRLVAGPIFPVKRDNDFAANAPVQKPPAFETNCSYPVIPIQTRETVFKGDVIQDWGGMPPILVGPKYIDTDGKNGFVPAPPVAGKMPPQVNFPIINVGVVAQNKFVPTLPPKIDSEKVISYPMLP